MSSSSESQGQPAESLSDVFRRAMRELGAEHRIVEDDDPLEEGEAEIFFVRKPRTGPRRQNDS
jgi:hypothetical protein